MTWTLDRRQTIVLLLVVAGALALMLLAADPVFADAKPEGRGTSSTDAGKNLRKVLIDIALPLLGGSAALMCVIAVVKHDFSMVITTFIIVIFAGLFLVEPTKLNTFISGIWSQVLK